MKKLATVISAASLAIVAVSASAWVWGESKSGDDGNYNRTYGVDGYPVYGYAPFGYGAPFAPAAGMTEEQKKAIADQQAAMAAQQAQFIKHMQEAQKQAAEFYASHPVPAYGVQPVIYGDEFMRQMEEMHAARVKEMEARMEASRKEMVARMEASRKAAEQRFGALPPMFDNKSFSQIEEEHAARAREMEARMEASRKEMEARMETSRKEMEAQMEASRKAAEQRFGALPYSDDFARQMEEEHAARVEEFKARMEESRKAAEERRKEAQERFENRMQDRAVNLNEQSVDKAGA